MFLIRILDSKFKARVFRNYIHCSILESNVTDEADVSSYVMWDTVSRFLLDVKIN